MALTLVFGLGQGVLKKQRTTNLSINGINLRLKA
jgi:hypothetical protein